MCVLDRFEGQPCCKALFKGKGKTGDNQPLQCRHSPHFEQEKTLNCISQCQHPLNGVVSTAAVINMTVPVPLPVTSRYVFFKR